MSCCYGQQIQRTFYHVPKVLWSDRWGDCLYWHSRSALNGMMQTLPSVFLLNLQSLFPWHCTEYFSNDPEDHLPSASSPRKARTVNPSSILTAHYYCSDYLVIVLVIMHSQDVLSAAEKQKYYRKSPSGSMQLVSTTRNCLQLGSPGQLCTAVTDRDVWTVEGCRGPRLSLGTPLQGLGGRHPQRQKDRGKEWE